VGAGIVLSTAIPVMMQQQVWWQGALWSAIAAGGGYFTLWGVVEFGKLAFGRTRTKYETAEPFIWTHLGEDAELKVGEESVKWSDTFGRDSDHIVLKCTRADIAESTTPTFPLHFYLNKLLVSGTEYDLNELKEITGDVL